MATTIFNRKMQAKKEADRQHKFYREVCDYARLEKIGSWLAPKGLSLTRYDNVIGQGQSSLCLLVVEA